MAQGAVGFIGLAKYVEALDGVLRNRRLITLFVLVPWRVLGPQGSDERRKRFGDAVRIRRSAHALLESGLVRFDSVQCHGNLIRITAHLSPPGGQNLAFKRGCASIPIPLLVKANVEQGWCVPGIHASVEFGRQSLAVGPALLRHVTGFAGHVSCLR